MIEEGSNVKINYKLEIDGETVESSFDKEPLAYEHGKGQLIPGLEEELTGTSEGAHLEVTVPPEKAYGPYNPEAVHEVAKDVFKDLEDVEVGGYVEGRTRTGEPFRARVTEEKPTAFVLDLNHPLAGKTLNFEVEVVAVE